MKLAQDIILRAVITEETMTGIAEKKYAFRVAKTATKPEIREAVEKLFDVKVKDVNTMNVRGQKRRYGNNEGYTSSWKKAIVTLTEDSKTIEFFDNMM